MTSRWKVLAAAGLIALGAASTAHADTFSGDLFYTHWTGGENVWKVHYTYDQATHSFALTANTPLAAAAGADGIIFDSTGNLLIGGQGTSVVHMYTPAGTFVDDGSANNNGSYHLSLDASGNSVYTSGFGGPLEVLPLAPNSVGNATEYTVSPTPGQAGEFGLTQVAYAPDTKKWFYVNGGPNGYGNLGVIDMSNVGTATHTVTTTRLYSSVEAAHGLLYDSYTNLMTIFGAGKTGTFDTSGNNLQLASADFACDFDQGATDGLGHALVAGCDAVTFLDYRVSHDITHPDYYTTIYGFGGIDDVAPLSGLGSRTPAPEPASVLLLGTGLAGLVRYRRTRRA